jgi:hypothetical protein
MRWWHGIGASSSPLLRAPACRPNPAARTSLLQVVELALEGFGILEIAVVDGMSCDPAIGALDRLFLQRQRIRPDALRGIGAARVVRDDVGSLSRFGSESGVSCVSRRGFGAISLS